MNICTNKEELKLRKRKYMEECENICCKDCKSEDCPTIYPCDIVKLYNDDLYWLGEENAKFECEYYLKNKE